MVSRTPYVVPYALNVRYAKTALAEQCSLAIPPSTLAATIVTPHLANDDTRIPKVLLPRHFKAWTSVCLCISRCLDLCLHSGLHSERLQRMTYRQDVRVFELTLQRPL